MTTPRFRFAFALAALASLLVVGSASSHTRHLRLVSSAPAADSVVAPPAEVRLTFSEAPQEGATRVRLLDQAENLVEVGAVVASDDGTVFHAPVSATLADGHYSVVWRTMAADGHVVDGELAFEVKADRR